MIRVETWTVVRWDRDPLAGRVTVTRGMLRDRLVAELGMSELDAHRHICETEATIAAEPAAAAWVSIGLDNYYPEPR